jgi:hypothetical protein
MRVVAALAAVFVVSAMCPSAQEAARPRATPIEPIGAIADVFRSHQIVAFADAHGNREMLAFGLAVVRDARVRAVINDVVIENGNARYQDVMDRYVRGENVRYEELRHVWHDTTQTQTLSPRDGSIPELYRLIRSLNEDVPRARQIRVLLGDPPIDWASVRSEADHRKWIEQRDSHAAEVIRRDVVARKRRGLIIYGQGHLQRRNLLANYDSEGLAGTVISILEKAAPTRAFSIWWAGPGRTLPAEVSSWPAPSLALVRGSTLGALDFTDFEGAPPARSAIREGKIVLVPREQWRSLRMEEQFDAVLSLGKSSDTFVPGQSELTPAFCRDAEWLSEWRRRLDLSPPGLRAESSRLQEYCSSIVK